MKVSWQFKSFKFLKGCLFLYLQQSHCWQTLSLFALTRKDDIYIAETFRQGKNRGVEANTSHMYWLNDDLQLQNVKQREAMYRKHLGNFVVRYTKEHDRIRLVEDTNNDGKANKRVALTTGYGVRVAFRGHDMHGLKMRYDGRIYYSIGDRGYSVTTKEGKKLHRPDTGTVFRCEQDGSHLEVFAYGLRNPQELAFDDYGNLFTGDNNSDAGDKSRWVYIVEGGDTGWRMYYQYLKDRGPFKREKLWKKAYKGQAAYIIPPVAYVANGPAGLVEYPGLGLSKRYKNLFFLCDFRGTPAKSGIHSFGIKPKGASFKLVDPHRFIWQSTVTDVDFGYDGSIYVADWVSGWFGSGKGRIYKFTDTNATKNPAIQQTQKLMKEGMRKQSTDQLLQLLNHPDKRVCLKAQFKLVEKKEIKRFQHAITNPKEPLFTKLHSVWGLGQILRVNKNITAEQWHTTVVWLVQQTNAKEAQVRIQVLRVLGDVLSRHQKKIHKELQTTLRNLLITRLSDNNAHVQYHATVALGKLGDAKAFDALLELLAKNNDKDAIIRHACVMGLVGIGDQQKLLPLAKHPSAAVRMGAVLAMRRFQMPEVALFLKDTSPQIVTDSCQKSPRRNPTRSHSNCREAKRCHRISTASYCLQ